MAQKRSVSVWAQKIEQYSDRVFERPEVLLAEVLSVRVEGGRLPGRIPTASVPSKIRRRHQLIATAAEEAASQVVGCIDDDAFECAACAYEAPRPQQLQRNDGRLSTLRLCHQAATQQQQLLQSYENQLITEFKLKRQPNNKSKPCDIVPNIDKTVLKNIITAARRTVTLEAAVAREEPELCYIKGSGDDTKVVVQIRQLGVDNPVFECPVCDQQFYLVLDAERHFINKHWSADYVILEDQQTERSRDTDRKRRRENSPASSDKEDTPPRKSVRDRLGPIPRK